MRAQVIITFSCVSVSAFPGEDSTMISSLRVRLDKLETKAKHVPSNEDRKTTRQDSQLERVRTSIQQKYGMLGYVTST